MITQKVNHFARSFHLTRKDCLKRSIAMCSRALGPSAALLELQPPTFVLPLEEAAFRARVAERNAQLAPQHAAHVAGGGRTARDRQGRELNVFNVWIVKPVNSSRGRGIYLSLDADAIVADAQAEKAQSSPASASTSASASAATPGAGASVVVQEYIASPLLVGGRKVDLRLYVCVTSFEPLEAFLYHEGYARYATQPYSACPSRLADLRTHLTNSSIAHDVDGALPRLSPDAGDADADSEARGNPKQLLSAFLRELAAAGADTARLLRDIDVLVLKSLLCVRARVGPQPHAFELFGVDVLLDAALRPWLIEANSSPSLNLLTDVDRTLKPRLLADTLLLAAPPAVDRAYLARLLTYRANAHAWPDPPGMREALQAAGAPERGPRARWMRQALHLHLLLRGRRPRLYGELPAHMGGYRRLAPGGPGGAWGDCAKLRALLARLRPVRKAGDPPPVTKTEYDVSNSIRNNLPGIV
jgi:hypothetical protein